MALDRIYGDYQTAGYKVTTAAKSTPNNSGTDGYAQAVVVVDPSGTPTSNPATIYTAQQTATSSAVALASQALVNGVVVTALSTNTNTVYVGPSGVTSSTGYPLIAGQSISFGVTNTDAIYIIAPTGSPVVSVAGN